MANMVWTLRFSCKEDCVAFVCNSRFNLELFERISAPKVSFIVAPRISFYLNVRHASCLHAMQARFTPYYGTLMKSLTSNETFGLSATIVAHSNLKLELKCGLELIFPENLSKACWPLICALAAFVRSLFSSHLAEYPSASNGEIAWHNAQIVGLSLSQLSWTSLEKSLEHLLSQPDDTMI